MASCHYSKIVIDFLKSKKLNFVAKNENAPNAPYLRPIEKFQALCKQEYKKLKESPTNESEAFSEWKKISKKVGKKFGKNLMKNFRKNLRYAAEKGIENS